MHIHKTPSSFLTNNIPIKKFKPDFDDTIVQYPNISDVLLRLPNYIKHIVWDITDVIILQNQVQDFIKFYKTNPRLCKKHQEKIHKLLKIGQSNNRTMGILSNTSHPQTYFNCAKLNKFNFKPIIFAYYGHEPKPLPQAYKNYMKFLKSDSTTKHLKPEQVAFIDNAQANLLIAKQTVNWYTIYAMPKNKKHASIVMQPYIDAIGRVE